MTGRRLGLTEKGMAEKEMKEISGKARHMREEKNLEYKLLVYGATTLAGLKTGCVFNMPPDYSGLPFEIDLMNARLNSRDIYVTQLCRNSRCTLVYVYRRTALLKDLRQQGARSILEGLQYGRADLQGYLETLRCRLSGTEGFPHEIGLFLGFPLEDVRCYIEKNGRDCKCCGFWKVYCNVPEAERQFARFRICNRIYAEAALQGIPVENMAVA
jgi:hypothetical protein